MRIVEAPDKEKMSEVILDFAEPLLENCSDNNELIKKAVMHLHRDPDYWKQKQRDLIMIHMTVHLTFSAFWIKAGWPGYMPIMCCWQSFSSTSAS